VASGKPLVGILMGSDSDLPVMAECARVLEDYGLGYDMRVLSAHRTPEQATAFAKDAEASGLKLVIAGAGGSAHLAGVVAAHTTLPVIGVPLAGSPLGGFDSLLSTVQMPPGIPVATMGVGPMGAKNAGHLAAAILSLSDRALRGRLKRQRQAMTKEVLKKGSALPARLRELLGK
jgi:phosphoribosylaminoimidazole carboxylase PurE protein